jgi:hypothetical protein
MFNQTIGLRTVASYTWTCQARRSTAQLDGGRTPDRRGGVLLSSDFFILPAEQETRNRRTPTDHQQLKAGERIGLALR